MTGCCALISEAFLWKKITAVAAVATAATESPSEEASTALPPNWGTAYSISLLLAVTACRLRPKKDAGSSRYHANRMLKQGRPCRPPPEVVCLKTWFLGSALHCMAPVHGPSLSLQVLLSRELRNCFWQRNESRHIQPFLLSLFLLPKHTVLGFRGNFPSKK